MNRIFTLLIAVLISIPLISQVEKKVVVEHFTNTRCGICASKNPAFYQVLNDYPDVLHIAYHPSSPYSTCIFSQHNPQENDHRAYFYNVFGSTPRVVLQGEVIPNQNPLINSGQIEAQLGGTSDYKVTMTKTALTGNNNKITLEIERVSGSEFETILVYAGLAEKEINYEAPNGESLHHDVFRRVIFFDTASINPVGNIRVIEYEYSTDAEWYENQIFAYALIQNSITSSIMQAGTTLESASGFGKEKINELSSILYPNPSSGIISVRNEFSNRFIKFEFYDLLGSRVREFNKSNSFNISDLPEGFYFVRLTDSQNKVYSTRIIKSNQ